jgi:pimeloyl-ACP methyl ester carboxylesterase
MTLTRRSALGGATAAAAALAAGCQSLPAGRGRPRTFVLVHGAWHGGWCWRYVRDILEAHGHRVYTPSLAGLADRSHQLSTAINLDTHIDDIANLFLWEDIEDAVLVAHSYGGWPVSGAIEKIGARVASLVYVDSYVPENGQRVMDFNSAQFREQLREAIARGDAGRPVPKADAFGIIDPKNAAWVQAKMTPQPTGTSVQPIRLTGARDRIARKTYIRAPRYPQPSFDGYLAKAVADPAWRTHVIPAAESGHDVMVDAPQRLAQLLEEAAAPF